MPPQHGQTLLHYTLVEEIGSGAMGTVWKAVDANLDREVAIKILPDELAADRNFRTRFVREAKLLASLDHPNLASVFGVHEVDGTHFLAMEFVPGEDLSQRIQEGPMPLRRALDVACRVADAIAAAHESGVIHRDLKPGNVRLLPDGRVKVLDFGLAKSLVGDERSPDGEPDDAATTLPGTVIGTAPYMSPEQARGQRLDVRSDIWSFGCVVFECLTGARPFAGETMPDQLASILKGEVRWDLLPATTPPGVERVLRRCLERDAARRWHHVSDVRIELEDAAAASPASTGAPPADAAARTASSRAPWVLAAVALVAGVVGALALGAGGDDGEATWQDPLVGAEYRWLTNEPGAEYDAAISPDGKLLAFVAEGQGEPEVRVGPLESGPYESLLVGAAAHLKPASRILTSNAVRGIDFVGTQPEIWVSPPSPARMKGVALFGGRVRDLLPPATNHADWHRDGRVVYQYGKDGDPLFVQGEAGKPTPIDIRTEPGYHQHFPTWSPDGRWIYVCRGRLIGGAMDLWRMRPDGREARQLTRDLRRVAYPTPLEDGSVWFVAQEADGSGPWLWVLDPESGPPRRLSRGPHRYVSVDATADGRLIVTTVERARTGLYEVPIRNEVVGEDAVRPRAVSRTRAHTPRISGDQLYFLSSQGTDDGLWRIGPDGKPVELWKGRDGGLVEAPGISRDGRFVSMVLRKEGRARLHVFDTEGGTEPVQISATLEVQGSACWSPDGEWLAVGGIQDGRRGLYRISRDGQVAKRLLTGDAANPAWAPDDSMIVFAGAQSNAYFPLIAVRPEDGRRVEDFPELRVVCSYGVGQPFAFVPDGSGFVFQEDRSGFQNLVLLELGTGKTRQLTDLRVRAHTLAFDFSADGKTLVFDRHFVESDILLIKPKQDD